jgi:hypothetical protein
MNKKSFIALVLSLLILSSCGPQAEDLHWSVPSRLGGLEIVDVPVFLPVSRWEVRNIENCQPFNDNANEFCQLPPEEDCYVFAKAEEKWCQVYITHNETVRTESVQREYNDQSPINIELNENELRGDANFSSGCIAFELEVTISAEPIEPIQFMIQFDDEQEFERAMSQRLAVGLNSEFKPRMYAFSDTTGNVDRETITNISDCGREFGT